MLGKMGKCLQPKTAGGLGVVSLPWVNLIGNAYYQTTLWIIMPLWDPFGGKII
jgi:hypothetical protein